MTLTLKAQLFPTLNNFTQFSKYSKQFQTIPHNYIAFKLYAEVGICNIIMKHFYLKITYSPLFMHFTYISIHFNTQTENT